MAKRVLVTGSAGYLGTRVALRLAEQGDALYGIDVREPANRECYAGFVRGSVTDAAAMERLFAEARPDAVVHLAFVVTTTHDRAREEAVALDGARYLLAGCAQQNVRKLVFLSSVAAYGAHDDNDVPLTEASPIRGVAGYGYSRLKAAADRLAQEFAQAHPACAVVILRPCLFLGAHTDNNFFDVLDYPIVPQIVDAKGIRDPQFQFIHEEEMADCVVAAVERDVRGAFNVAGEGTPRFSELIRRYGKRRIAVPAWFLYPATALLWRLRLVTAPPAQLDFIRYPWIMDVSRMRRELFTPRRTSLEAFAEYAAARGRS